MASMRARGLAVEGAAAATARLLSSDSPQSEIRRVVQAHRSETLARAPPPMLVLQRQLRLVLGQLSSQVGLRSSPAVLEKTTIALNRMIAETRWELDEKVEECRERPDALADEASDANLDVQELAAQVSSIRTEVLQATEEYPEDKEYLISMKTELREEKRDCSMELREHTERGESIRADQDAVRKLGKMIHDFCVNWNLAQVSAVGDAARAAARASPRPSWTSLLRLAESFDAAHRHLRSASPKTDFCDAIKDHIDALRGEIEDNAGELDRERQEQKRQCEEQAAKELQEIERIARRKGDLSAAMSQATGRVNVFSERLRERDDERRRLREDARFAKRQCEKEVDELLHEKLCGLVRLRDQLWLQAGKQDLPQDCQVTEWAGGECSASCGGGTQQATRLVIVAAWKGAECPPLKMHRRCNENHCPQNCVVSFWTGWSACSSACDGGIQERTRAVTTKERYGGDPCPELIEMRTCSPRACSRDCELGSWTEWSLCSQACDQGSQRRHRRVMWPPEGAGSCPAEDAPQRMESRPCNVEACPDLSNLQCAGPPLDVVLLVDSSGSMSAFENIQAFLKSSFAPRLALGTSADASHMALIQFSDTAKVLSGFDGDINTLAPKIDSMKGMGGYSMLSHGLALTGSFLAEASRPQAAPTIIVLTDGHIADPFLASQQAAKLRSQGFRLMLILVGENHPNDDLFGKLITQPARENLFRVNSTLQLKANEKVIGGSVLSRICGEVIVP